MYFLRRGGVHYGRVLPSLSFPVIPAAAPEHGEGPANSNASRHAAPFLSFRATAVERRKLFAFNNPCLRQRWQSPLLQCTTRRIHQSACGRSAHLMSSLRVIVNPRSGCGCGSGCQGWERRSHDTSGALLNLVEVDIACVPGTSSARPSALLRRSCWNDSKGGGWQRGVSPQPPSWKNRDEEETLLPAPDRPAVDSPTQLPTRGRLLRTRWKTRKVRSNLHDSCQSSLNEALIWKNHLANTTSTNITSSIHSGYCIQSRSVISRSDWCRHRMTRATTTTTTAPRWSNFLP